MYVFGLVKLYFFCPCLLRERRSILFSSTQIVSYAFYHPGQRTPHLLPPTTHHNVSINKEPIEKKARPSNAALKEAGIRL